MSENEEQTPQKKRKWGKYVARAFACVALALLFFLLGWFGHLLSLGEKMRSLIWAVGTAEENYYREVDEDALFSDIFSAFGLDDYSGYYTKEEYAQIVRANEGNGTGVGLSIGTFDGRVRLTRVSGNSPAEKAGLRAGMYVFRFGGDEKSLCEGGKDELASFIRGCGAEDEVLLEAGYDPDGSDAAVYSMKKGEGYALSECLYRDGERSLRFDPGHGYAETPTADGGIEGLPADTAYLRIDAFYGHAPEETVRALTYMKETGRTHLILDLRSNGGGYLSVFQEISAHFLRNAEGKAPVVAKAKFKSGKVVSYAAPANDFGAYFTENSKIYILADEGTASASECLIGALVSYGTAAYSDIFLRGQENGAAKTYGKGIMQTNYEGPGGNVLKLTSAEIFWPNGRSIHGTGVTKEDGAVAVSSPLLHGAEDAFLAEVLRLTA